MEALLEGGADTMLRDTQDVLVCTVLELHAFYIPPGV